MPIQSLAPRRLYRQIADQLRGLIRSGEFAVGTRLPPERDLAQQLGVSRPSVREALIALEVEGLVSVRMGSGIEVIAREPAASAPRVDTAFGPFETLLARQLLEAELAAHAALHCQPAQLQNLQQALALMAADVAAGLAPVRGDRLFHLGVAEAAGHGPLVRTVAELYDERENALFEQLGQHFETGRSWQLALAEHQAVLAAIAAGDAPAARVAMHRHLQQSHDRLAASVAAPGAEAALPVSPTTVSTTASTTATTTTAATTAAVTSSPRRRPPLRTPLLHPPT